MTVCKSQNYKGRITDQWFPGTEGEMRFLYERGHEGTYYDGSNVLDLDCDGDYVTMNIFQSA